MRLLDCNDSGLLSANLINQANNLSNIACDYSLSESIYSYGYDLRLKYASFMHDTLNWIANNYTEVLSAEKPGIMSLGCGTGTFDSEFIKLIKQRTKEWSFTGLDFSATDLEHFRKNLSALDRQTRTRVTLEYKKFESSTDLGERYDLITMVHFLHSFDDVMPIIQNALKHVLPGGNLLIVQQNKKGIAELKDRFQGILPNQKFQCSEHIKKRLQTEKVAFTAHEIETSFDVSIMRKMSLDTLLLMSFCLVNDLSLLDTQQQEKIRQAFLSIATEQNDGKIVISESMEVIVCHV